jgi:nuclear GTP-binding protein
MRTKATIDRLRMYKNFKPVRSREGKIIKPAPFQGWNTSGTQARVEPNRKWFGNNLSRFFIYFKIVLEIGLIKIGNTRVIAQSALQQFQDEIAKAKNDPYKLIIKPTNLPTTILNEKAKVIFTKNE